MNDARWGETLDARNPCPDGIPSSGRTGKWWRLLSRSRRRRFAFGIALLPAMLAASPSSGLGQGTTVSSQIRPDVLKIGYIETAFYDLRVKDAQVALEMWGSSLINREESPLNRVDALIIPSLADLQKAVSKDELDVVILGSVDYLMLKDRSLIEPVMAPSSRNDCLQNYLILVRKDRGINELAQLRDSRLLLALGGEGDSPGSGWTPCFSRRGWANPHCSSKR